MSVRFNASGEKLTRTANLPSQMRGVTICGWFLPLVDRNNYSCVFNISKGTNPYAYIETGNDGITMRVWHPTSNAQLIQVTLNTWYFFAMTIDASSGVVIGYYGTLTSNTLTSATPANSIGSGQVPDLISFGDSCFGGEFFNGDAFACKVWTATLTQAELEQEMQTVRPQRTANLHSWLPCLPGSGERARDYSGNGYDYTEGGTLSDEDHPPIGWGSPVLILPYVAVAAGGGATYEVTGGATAGLTALSIDQAIFAEAGVAVAAAMASGGDAATFAEMGVASGTLAVHGGDAATFAEAGGALAGLTVTGSSAIGVTYIETGGASGTLVALGADAATFTDTGAGLAGMSMTATDVTLFGEAGYTAASVTAAGGDVTIYAEAGYVVGGVTASGASEWTPSAVPAWRWIDRGIPRGVMRGTVI